MLPSLKILITNFAHDAKNAKKSTKLRPKRAYTIDSNELSQAERVFKRFGSANDLTKALRRAGHSKHASSVYRWGYSKKEGGTDGRIPTAAWPAILAAARLEGIFLTAFEFDPTTKPVKDRVALELRPNHTQEEKEKAKLEQIKLDKRAHKRARLRDSRIADAEAQKEEETELTPEELLA